MGTTKLVLDYDYDFLLIGILASVPDYKLCWGMNKALKILLRKEKDLELRLHENEKKEGLKLTFETPEMTPLFSMYSFYNEVNHVKYTVAANKSASGLLVKEEQSVDFFLVVEGLYDDSEKEEVIISALREQREIITAYKIDPNNLKSKQNLIFE
ncbi:MAG: IPExxxVDY family protein [Flavobacteriales bacterium]|nr:IPExxxVDY family protein [Flavobacteriales bacterium]